MNNEVFHSALDASPEGVTVHRIVRDETGAFRDLEALYQNASATRMLGIPAEALIGKRIAELFPSERQMPAWEVYRRVADGEAPIRTELPYRWEGNDGWFEVTVVRVCDRYLVLFGRDISERRRIAAETKLLAEVSAALATSVELQETLETVARLCVPELADVCGLYVGSGSSGRAAWVHRDPLKEPVTLQLARELAQGLPKDSLAERALQQGETLLWDGVTPLLLADHLKKVSGPSSALGLGICSVLCTPLVATSGKVLGVLWLGFADSGRRHAQANVALAEEIARRAAMAIDNALLREKQARADRSKDEFLVTLAHELRNPLAPIRSSAQLLRLSGSTDPSIQKAGAVIERQIDHLVHLIDDLLDVGRIASGKIELRRRQLDLSEIVNAAVETSTPLIEARSHLLRVTLPPERLRVDGDLTRLSQVLATLLNNAARYTPRAGQLSLIAAREANEVVVRVGDNGQGISKETLTNLFETRGSHGIGLNLARSLVAMHGGTVEARSEGLEQGSEFIVRLPLAASPAEVPAAPPAAELAAAEAISWRILVVDDNPDSAEALSSLLELMGNEVRAARDGPSALGMLGDFVPDLVLLDIGMPGMSGYDVARTIRKMPRHEKTVLVAQTGWGKPEDRRRSHEAGFDHHLTKPLDLSALERLLVELKRGRAEA
ncbi:MAG: tmoS [Myxococcaceae bacterium]|nr:tmoS [Myxococcaceae bacterium]